MRLLYLLVDETSPSAERVGRRLREGQARLPEGWTFAVESIRIGPPYYEENVLGHALAVPGIVHAVLERQHAYDAILIGCFGDPGLAPARAVARVPVVGPAEASFLLTRLTARRFGIVTMGEGDVPELLDYVAVLGLETRSAGVMPIDMPVDEVFDNLSRTRERLLRAIDQLVARGAEAVILGCMSLGFYPFADELQEEVDAAVIDPLRASIAALQATATLGVRLGPPAPSVERPGDVAGFLSSLERTPSIR